MDKDSLSDPLLRVKEELEVLEISSPEQTDELVENIVEAVLEDVKRANVSTDGAIRRLSESLAAVGGAEHEETEQLPPFVTREKERPPHTVTGLVLMLAILTRIAFFSKPRASFEREIRVGLGSAAAVFLFYCTLQLQDGEVTRPHPVLWRFIHGVVILYMLLLVFLLSLSEVSAVDSTMQVLLDPTSGTAPLPRDEVSHYTTDCSLGAANLWSKVWDQYFFAHFFGWMVKALILRDWGVMWTCSVVFEVAEITLQRAMPNFKECWWDRWGLDMFGCNFAGMYCGMKLAAWLGAREYDWSGLSVLSKKRKLLHRVMRFATPKVFPRRFEWHAFSSWKRFGVSVLVVLIIILGDTNGFLLKSALQIPTVSYLNAARVVMITPAGYASVVELYAFAEDRTNRIGRIAWISVAVSLLELLLSLKHFYLRSSFTPEQLILDDQVRWAWIATAVCAVIVAFLKLSRIMSSNKIRFFGRLAMLPFVLLLVWDAWVYGGLKTTIIGQPA